MKKWGEMSDEEREDFLLHLDHEDELNERRWREHIILVDPLLLDKICANKKPGQL